MSDSVNTASLQQPEEENFETKCLYVLVLDTSGSMNTASAINELNNGLQTFKDCAMHSLNRDCLEIAIITFDSKVSIIQQPALLANVTMPTLTASGQTQLVSAIEEAQKIVEDRKVYWKTNGIPYYRPWIVIMTDGDSYPEKDFNGNIIQDIDAVASRVQQDVDDKKYVFFIIGIGNDIQDDTLTTLSTKQFPALRISDVRFEELFWRYIDNPSPVVSTSGDILDSWESCFIIGASK